MIQTRPALVERHGDRIDEVGLAGHEFDVKPSGTVICRSLRPARAGGPGLVLRMGNRLGRARRQNRPAAQAPKSKPHTADITGGQAWRESTVTSKPLGGSKTAVRRMRRQWPTAGANAARRPNIDYCCTAGPLQPIVGRRGTNRPTLGRHAARRATAGSALTPAKQTHYEYNHVPRPKHDVQRRPADDSGRARQLALNQHKECADMHARLTRP